MAKLVEDHLNKIGITTWLWAKDGGSILLKSESPPYNHLLVDFLIQIKKQNRLLLSLQMAQPQNPSFNLTSMGAPFIMQSD